MLGTYTSAIPIQNPAIMNYPISGRFKEPPKNVGGEALGSPNSTTQERVR